jgi:hypothetical protein
LISAMVVASMAAPPMPCTARAAISSPTSGASPQASEASANSTSPAR